MAPHLRDQMSVLFGDRQMPVSPAPKDDPELKLESLGSAVRHRNTLAPNATFALCSRRVVNA